MISGSGRPDWSAKPGSRSRKWPGIWGINEGTPSNWVIADKRRRGEGNGALDEDELARPRRKNAERRREAPP